MKKKELKKKLSLKKQTISALTPKESSKIKGGASVPDYVCGVTLTMKHFEDACGPILCEQQ